MKENFIIEQILKPSWYGTAFDVKIKSAGYVAKQRGVREELQQLKARLLRPILEATDIDCVVQVPRIGCPPFHLDLADIRPPSVPAPDPEPASHCLDSTSIPEGHQNAWTRCW